MKVTCEICKRRFRVKRSKPRPCICGKDPRHFSRELALKAFRDNDMRIVRALSSLLLGSSSIEDKAKIVATIVEGSLDPSTRMVAMLTAVDVIRMVRGACPMRIARALVMQWPYISDLRMMMANCLSLSGGREDRLEAMKQRLIAMDLRMRSARNLGELTNGLREDMVESYRKDLEAEIEFLEGARDYPNRTVKRILTGRIEADPGLIALIDELESIDRTLEVPRSTEVPVKVRIVMDTNSITNNSVWKDLSDPSISLMAPEEVLFEVARWCHIERIPVELDKVRFLPVNMKVPKEIERIRSPKREKNVSLCDRKVATLALQEGADLVLSSDCDLLRSDLRYISEKHWGKGIDVVAPVDLGRWLSRHGIGLQKGMAADVVHEETVASL